MKRLTAIENIIDSDNVKEEEYEILKRFFHKSLSTTKPEKQILKLYY
jgi:hypothetical protein